MDRQEVEMTQLHEQNLDLRRQLCRDDGNSSRLPPS